MSGAILPTVLAAEFQDRRVYKSEPETFAAVSAIVRDVRKRGLDSVIDWGRKFGDIKEDDDDAIIGQAELKAAFQRLPERVRALLERAADRIARFALAQRECLTNLSVEIPGGTCGHFVDAMETVACYAPGGRYPLPSTVLMTAVTAKAAGVREVWLASPHASDVILGAAWVAKVDNVLKIGGAQAIAAFAYGAAPIPKCDAIVGPGNKWVTTAKEIVAGITKIDMLAGPSELLVLADSSADVRYIAADLLAQAEHDPDAYPVLISTDRKIIHDVNEQLRVQLADLPSAEVARAALRTGCAVLCDSIEEAIKICDAIAPEHLQLMVQNPRAVVPRLKHYGALFIGQEAAEVFGDFGAGPNHVLPTGGTARQTGGLSVFNFMRVRTFLEMKEKQAAQEIMQDSAEFARVEGLEAHARAALIRLEK